MSAVLEYRDVERSFGGPRAQGVDLSIDVGRIVGLLGPNGSSKTTNVNAIIGFYLIENGCLVMAGTAESLSTNPEVQEFCLGGGHQTDHHRVKHYRRRTRWPA